MKVSAQEPRDGDFVAYIEVLQRESAARLHAQPQPMAEPGTAAAPQRSDPGATAPVLNRQQAEELIARLAEPGRAAQLRNGLIALAVGIVLLIGWLVGDSGVVPLLISAALIAWAVSRLRRAARRSSGPGARGHIERVLGRKHSQ